MLWCGRSKAVSSFERIFRFFDHYGSGFMLMTFLAGVTDEQLGETRPNPHDPDHEETVRSCLHVILEEEWEHHRKGEWPWEPIES